MTDEHLEFYITHWDLIQMMQIAKTDEGMRDLLKQVKTYYALVNTGKLPRDAREVVEELRAKLMPYMANISAQGTSVINKIE